MHWQWGRPFSLIYFYGYQGHGCYCDIANCLHHFRLAAEKPIPLLGEICFILVLTDDK